MQVDADATVLFGGNRAGMCSLSSTCTSGGGGIILAEGGRIILNNADSHMIFGENADNNFNFQATFGSLVTVNNPTALISFQLATFNIAFDNHSALSLLFGGVEFNLLRGAYAPGLIETLIFSEGSSLQVQKIGTESALLSLSPNLVTDPSDLFGPNLNFNNETGVVYSNGDIQYIAFDITGTVTLVNTILELQPNVLNIEQPMVQAFMGLTYFLQPGLIETPDATILAQQGTRPNPINSGELVAFCPVRDGSVVGLSQGDHDVFYDTNTPGGALNLVRGYDALGNLFTITNCDAATRNPAAPVF
jgi:hypothetical protein